MERGGRDRRGDWISPDAYDALSPEEKRAIWNERKRQPRTRRREPGGPNGGSTWLGYGAAAALIAGITAWEAARSPLFDTSNAASAVRTSFGLCHTGGGTNCVRQYLGQYNALMRGEWCIGRRLTAPAFTSWCSRRVAGSPRAFSSGQRKSCVSGASMCHDAWTHQMLRELTKGRRAPQTPRGRSTGDT